MLDDKGLDVPVPKRVKDYGINEKLNLLLEGIGLDEEKLISQDASRKAGKVKPFKLKRKIERQVERGLKKGKVNIIYVRQNRAIVPLVGKVQDGRFFCDGTWRTADPRAMFMWGKIPTFIQPEWSINPVVTWDKDGSVDVGNSADAERVVLDILERSDTLQKPNLFKGKAWVWFAIGGIIVAYLIFGGG